jgi:hypothetical protein
VSVGYIYILSNATMPGLLKIGYTTKDNIKERVQEISSATGVPEPFTIEYYCLTHKVEEIEGKVHQHFMQMRHSGKEFFAVDIQEAVMFIDKVIQNVEPDRFCRTSLRDENQCQMRWLRCRTCKHEWPIPEESIDPPCPECGWHVADRLRSKPTKTA